MNAQLANHCPHTYRPRGRAGWICIQTSSGTRRRPPAYIMQARSIVMPLRRPTAPVVPHHGCINHLALAGSMPLKQRRDNAQRACHAPAGKVGEQVQRRVRRRAHPAQALPSRAALRSRPAPGRSHTVRYREHSRLGHEVNVMPGAVGQRPCVAALVRRKRASTTTRRWYVVVHAHRFGRSP